MSFGNTVKDGSGSAYWLLVDSNGYQVVKTPGRSVVQLTADGQIKASAGTLHGLVIAGAGVTAGNTVVIKDGGSGGTARLTVVFGAANETIVIQNLSAAFATDIYCDVTISGGSVYVSAVYE